MGNSKSVVYSVPITKNEINGESEIYRSPQYKDKIEICPEGLETLQAVFKNSVEKYPNSNLLGYRDQVTNEYIYKTYQQCNDLAMDFGSGLINLDLVPERAEYQDYKLRMIGVYSKNRYEYLIEDYAAMLYGLTSVPIYDTLHPNAIEYILDQTNLTTMCLNKEGLAKLLERGKMGKLENLVSFDDVTEDDKKKAGEKGFKLYQFSDIVSNGNAKKQEIREVKPDDIYIFSYTSGTTGNPKGALLSHKNMVATAHGVLKMGANLHPQSRCVSFLPLAHVGERMQVNMVIMAGCSTAFWRGDVKLLKDDICAIKPTFFGAVPRVHNRFYDVIKEQMSKAEGVKKTIVEKAISSKLESFQKNCDYKHFLYDKLVFNKVKQAFGGEIQGMVTGAAPISADVTSFLKIALQCPLQEGYGQTESGGINFLTSPEDPTGGHVGGVICTSEFKVVDVPEMNYTSKDKDGQGNNTPRGEICIRGPQVIPGYYKDEVKTKETFRENGWLHTGDVVQVLPNGGVKIIDRVKNIFKLAQGEYVAGERVENSIVKSDAVLEIYLYGDSLQSYCVAAVFPEEKFVQNIATQNNIYDKSFADLVQDPVIVKGVHDEIVKVSKQEKLNGIEIPKKILLTNETFGAYGLHTDTFKLKRFQAKQYFKEQFDKLYASN